MVGDGLKGVFLRIPCHVHEERDGILHRFQVTHVENPHTLDAEVVGQGELFEHLLCLRDIEPLGVAGCSDIVHMIVDAPATLAAAFLLGYGHTADVAPVVVADQDHHVIGHFETCVVIVLHFFIQGPYLRGFLCRFACNFLDDFALVADDSLHQLCVGLVAHGLVAIATHTDGDDVLGALHALDAFTEELVELFLVCLVVPCSPFTTMTGILLMVAGHRLMVRGAHHDAHTVGQLAILRIVGIESPSPHGRPHHVAL